MLELERLEPEETLFIDDTLGNIEGAQKAEMRTIYLQKPNTILDLEL
jgi:putative hydrolase of the HAD superfamily